MSLSKSITARRRLALFTSSSAAAALVLAIPVGIALMPTAAAAQATCTATTAVTGNGANTVTIAGGTNNPGILCNYIGQTATVSTLGAITVSSSGGVPADPLVNGVNLRATGTDDITWASTAGTVTGSSQTNGPVIDARTGGDIRLSTGAVTGTSATVTHGIYAASSGAGEVTIMTAGTVSGTNATSGVAGIEAISAGGDINIQASAATSGRLYGIRAATTGDGSIHFRNTGFSSVGASSTTGNAALDLTAGTGLIQVDLEDSGSGVVNATRTNSVGIRITTNGGDAIINRLGAGGVRAGGAASGGGVNTNTMAFEFNMNGGTSTINNLAASGSLGQSNPNLLADGLLRGQGDGAIVFNNTNSAAYGVIDLSDFDGSFTMNNHAAGDGWTSRGVNQFSQGNDTINNDATGVIVLGAINNRVQGSNDLFALHRTSLLFGDGTDAFNNAGTLVIGLKNNESLRQGTTLSIQELTAFNNSGTIVLGALDDNVNDGLLISDGDVDDVLVLLDSHFTGAEGSRILVDAFFNETGQASCARGVELGAGETDAVVSRADGSLANDCLDFRGSQVSGQTEVVLNDILVQDRGAYNPEGNVLVDVRGGVVDSPDAFVLSPDSAGYQSIGNGIIDKGLFAYAIGFEAEEDGQGGQFKIYGVESATSQQFPLLAQTAAEVWRMGASSWTERSASQREGDAALTGRTWIRLAAGTVDRAARNTVRAGDTPLVFDNSHAMDTKSVTVGFDLGSASIAGGEWLVGAMFGYGRAEVEYDAMDNTGNVEGSHFGLYSGFTAGSFFQDLVIDAAVLGLENDVPVVGLVSGAGCDAEPYPGAAPCVDTSERPILETDVLAGGVHADTGWRIAVGDRVSLEPMVSLQWLNTRINEMAVPADDPDRLGGEVNFDDARSLRAGFGLRVGIQDLAPSVMPIGVRLTAKAMQEMEGETTVRIVNVGPDAAVITNTFEGNFNELNAAVTLGDGSGHIGGFLNVGGVWAEGYDSHTGSLGVRLRW